MRNQHGEKRIPTTGETIERTILAMLKETFIPFFEQMLIKMGRLLKSQPIELNMDIPIDNIRCEILSRLVVGLTSFDVTHTYPNQLDILKLFGRGERI